MVTQTALGRRVFPRLSAQYPDDARFSQFVPTDDELADILDGAEIDCGTEDEPEFHTFRRVRLTEDDTPLTDHTEDAAERALRVELYAEHVAAHGTHKTIQTEDGQREELIVSDDAAPIPYLVSDCVAADLSEN